MTKQEAEKKLVQWLDHSNLIRRHILSGYYLPAEIEHWFSFCAEMYAAYKAIQDHSTGEDMPIDRPALEMEDFVNDGCNGFTRQ